MNDGRTLTPNRYRLRVALVFAVIWFVLMGSGKFVTWLTVGKTSLEQHMIDLAATTVLVFGLGWWYGNRMLKTELANPDSTDVKSN